MKNKIFWMIQEKSNLPDKLDWLAPMELNQVAGFRFQKRRDDWLLGRWTAKKLILTCYSGQDSIDPKDIVIQNEASGAPYALLQGTRMLGTISISHRGEYAAATFTENPKWSLGIDLELIEEKTQGFLDDYFTTSEVQQIKALSSNEQALASSLLWSGREAMVKAHQIGLRLDTRVFELKIPSATIHESWQHLKILVLPAEMGKVSLFWRMGDCYLITLAVKQKNQETEITPDLIIQKVG